MTTAAPWTVGDTVDITWITEDWLDNDGNPLTVKIELSRDNGGTWATLAASTADDGAYSWEVTAPAAAQCKIRLSDLTEASVNWTSSAFIIQLAASIKHLANKKYGYIRTAVMDSFLTTPASGVLVGVSGNVEIFSQGSRVIAPVIAGVPLDVIFSKMASGSTTATSVYFLYD